MLLHILINCYLTNDSLYELHRQNQKTRQNHETLANLIKIEHWCLNSKYYQDLKVQRCRAATKFAAAVLAAAGLAAAAAVATIAVPAAVAVSLLTTVQVQKPGNSLR